MLWDMFTGLVQHLGRIDSSAPRQDGGGRLLGVSIAGWSHRPAHGESIAVNGCCLTVAAVDDEMVRFDVISQTLMVTTLGELQPGDSANLEHAVTLTTMLGGHVVQGHVDGVGTVRQVTRDASQHRMRIEPPTQGAVMRLIVDKGSIAVNGVSLTVAGTGVDWFDVALIPTTLERTNLGNLREGDRVNLEYDYIAKLVVNCLDRSRA